MMSVKAKNEKLKKLLARLCENPNLRVSQLDFARFFDIDRSVPSRLCQKGILPENRKTSSVALYLLSVSARHLEPVEKRQDIFERFQK